MAGIEGEGLFTLRATDGGARLGELRLPSGSVATPVFMPVGTQASVKSVDPNDLHSVGAAMLLANAYHLYLRPGVDVVRDCGGLGAFMGWKRPTLTDSGGFQGMSLAHLRGISEEGIRFRSHLDGSSHLFSPESAVRHQEGIGADVIMPLDVCAPAESGYAEVAEAVERTTRWAERSLAAKSSTGQTLFGIMQGGVFPDLRERSAAAITALAFPGYAIGGLSVGETKEDMLRAVSLAAPLLPERSPRYLMGVGSPEDLVECVARGIDMFDCVLPTRTARNGSLYTQSGRVNVAGAAFRDRRGPIDDECDCYTCARFSSAYVHHLFRANELLAFRLGTIHNLRFILRLMERARAAIAAGTFAAFRSAFHARFTPPDETTRREQRRKWLASQNRRARAAGGAGKQHGA